MSVLAVTVTPWIAAHAQSALDDLAPAGEVAPALAPTALRQPLRDVSATVTYLSARTLSDNGILGIGEALHLLLGTTPNRLSWASYAPGLNAKTTVGPSRVTVLIDGIEVDPSLLAASNIGGLPVGIDDVDHIEITQGPATTGFNHALTTDVVNVVTKHPDDVERAYLRATTGSYDNASAFVRAGTTFGPESLRVTLVHHDRGPSDLQSTNGSGDADLNVDRITVRSSTRIGDASTLAIDAAYLNGTLSNLAADANVTGTGVRNGYQALSWISHLAPTNELTFRLNNWFDENDVQSSTSQRRTLAELQDVHVFGDSLRVGLGYGVRHEQDRDGSTRTSWAATFQRLYTNVEWQPLAPLALNFGASSDHASSINHEVSVRAGANWHLDDQQTLRVAWSTGSWASDVDATLQQPGQLIGNERIQSADAGWLFETSAHDATLSTRAFWYHLLGESAKAATDQTAPPEHQVWGEVHGLEARGTADLNAWLSGFANVSMAIEGGNSSSSAAGNNWFAQGSLGVDARFGAGWHTSAVYYVGSLHTTNTQPSGLVGLTALKDFDWLGARARASLTARHVANGHSKASDLGEDETGKTTVYLSLQLAY